MAKGKGNNTVMAVRELIEPVINEMHLTIWDIRYEKEGPDRFLRIFVEGEKPLDMDTCEAATRAVNPILDEADIIDGSYYMELGSPGLGRRLERDEHFTAMLGKTVEAVLIRATENSGKSVRGTLKSKEAGVIVIDSSDGEQSIDMATVSYVRLCDDDDLFLK